MNNKWILCYYLNAFFLSLHILIRFSSSFIWKFPKLKDEQIKLEIFMKIFVLLSWLNEKKFSFKNLKKNLWNIFLNFPLLYQQSSFFFPHYFSMLSLNVEEKFNKLLLCRFQRRKQKFFSCACSFIFHFVQCVFFRERTRNCGGRLFIIRW